MKVTITRAENGSYQIVDPESGAVYSNKNKERVKEIFVNRYVRFEDEDITPEETVEGVLSFLKMGMTMGDIIYRMTWYEAEPYEPNSFQYLSNRAFIELMHKACTSELPEVDQGEHREFLQSIPTDLFDIVNNTDLVIAKSFNVVANVPLTNWGSKAYWILKDDTQDYTLIVAWKDSSFGWMYFERSADSTDKLLTEFVSRDDCGVNVRYNLELQLKKMVAIGVFRMKETRK